MTIVNDFFNKTLKDKTLTKEEKIQKMARFFRKEYPKVSMKDTIEYCEYEYKEFIQRKSKKSDTSFYYG
jgi:hypothetical protein